MPQAKRLELGDSCRPNWDAILGQPDALSAQSLKNVRHGRRGMLCPCHLGAAR